MIALALEFSSASRSIALVDLPSAGTTSGESAGARVLSSVREEGPAGHDPMPLLERSLAAAEIEREAVEVVVVGLGPGSYTGIRAAIALAQGWQLARNVQLLGVGSIEALAWQARELRLLGQVHLAIDAQRGEFYLASYDLAEATELTLAAPLRLADRAELDSLAASGAPLLGPGMARWFPAARNLDPSAAALGPLAVGRVDFLSGEKLEPIYLREVSFVKAPPPRLPS